MCRERKVDTQAEVATRRLERLEREKEDEEDREHETNLEEALTDKTKVVKLVVDKWFVDRGLALAKSLLAKSSSFTQTLWLAPRYSRSEQMRGCKS